MRQKEVIAILGGMGPEASAKMLEVMVSMAASEFDARDCRDFPEIIVDSVPVPDFIANRKELKTVTKMLTDRISRLENFNIFCFAMACNTAHIIFDDLALVSSAPFVSMIKAVVDEVAIKGIDNVGLLATPSTIKSGLYQEELKKAGIRAVLPSKGEILSLEKIIRNIIAKKNTDCDLKKLTDMAFSLKSRGAKAIILGCTELPLIFPKEFPVPVFNSIDILSRSILRRFFQ